MEEEQNRPSILAWLLGTPTRVIMTLLWAMVVVSTGESFGEGGRRFFIGMVLFVGSLIIYATISELWTMREVILEQVDEINARGFVCSCYEGINVRLVEDAVNLTGVQEYYKDTPIRQCMLSIVPPAGLRIQVGDGKVWVDLLYNDLRRDWQNTLDKAKVEFFAKAKMERVNA